MLYGGFLPDLPLSDLSFVLGEVMNYRIITGSRCFSFRPDPCYVCFLYGIIPFSHRRSLVSNLGRFHTYVTSSLFLKRRNRIMLPLGIEQAEKMAWREDYGELTGECSCERLQEGAG